MSSGPQSDNDDSIPVKETESSIRNSVRQLQRHNNNNNNNNPRITRDEQEDRYLNIIDENINLKKQVHHHEERIKQLATKLVRLVGEKSVSEKRNDFVLENQKGKILELEDQINMLKDKVMSSSTNISGTKQIGSSTNTKVGFNVQPIIRQKPMKFKIPPTNVKSRTGLTPVTLKNSKSGLNQSQQHHHGHGHNVSSDGAIIVNDQVTQLLFEAKGENHALRDQVKRLREDLSEADKEISSYKEQLQIKEIEHEDEISSLRFQIESELDHKKQAIDNIQLARLQRDSRRTANWLTTYETKCASLESNLASANQTILQLESQVENVQSELREEQTKNLNLMKQVEEASAIIHQMKEIETQMKALQGDNKLLKEANESLMTKVFESGNLVKSFEKEDDSLKVQISTLEQTIRAELQSKSELLSSLNQEKAKCLSLQSEINILNVTCNSLSEQLREAELKLAHSQEISNLAASSQKHSRADNCDKCLIFEVELNTSKFELVQLRDELNKTKHLLRTQININKEYQKEIDVLGTKLEKSETFHQDKLHDFMKLLEQRAEQMTNLEKNLESLSMRSMTPTTTASSSGVITMEAHAQTTSQPDQIIPESSRSVSQQSQQFGEFGSHPNQESTTPAYFIRAETPPPTTGPINELIELTNHSSEIEQEDKFNNKEPTLEIYIDKLEAFDKSILAGLFVTWEFEPYERKYSPVVSNGIFNTMSSHSFSNKRFPIDGIEIQIHQAVGSSDCKTLGNGFLHVGSNLTSPMYLFNSTLSEEHKLFGHLHYSCIIENFDGENNNIYEQRKIYPPELTRTAIPLRQPSTPMDVTVPKIMPRKKSIENPLVTHAQSHTDKEAPIPSTSKSKQISSSRSSPNHDDNGNKNVSSREPNLKVGIELFQEVAISSPKKHVKMNGQVVREKREEKQRPGQNSPKNNSSYRQEPNNEIIEERILIESQPEIENESGSQELRKLSQDSKKHKIIPEKSDFEEQEGNNDISTSVSNSTTTTISKRRRQRMAPSSLQPQKQKQQQQAQSSNAQRNSVQPLSHEDSSTFKSKSNEVDNEYSEDDDESETSKNITDFESSINSDEDELVTKIPSNSCIRIEICYVTFNSTNRIWSDARIKRFFIEYRFLNYPQEELETPNALPKPQPGRPATFNFIKVFGIDTEEKCKLLRQMIKKHGRIRFTIVSEPNEDDSIDCEDLGYGTISLNELLKHDSDLIEQEIPLYDAENTKVQIGVICISVSALDVLRHIL